MSLGQNLRQKRQFCLQEWTVGHQAVKGFRDGAGLQAQEGSSCGRLLPTLPFPRHQCEEEMRAVSSSDSRQGRATSQLPL